METGNYGRIVHYQVLGPLRVTRDGEELPLGGPQQRLVLALLITEDGRTVSTAKLIEGVWGEDEPATAKKTLQGYIHHLRSQVGDALKTEGSGYSLDTGSAVDAIEFEQLREAGRGAMAADTSNAADLFRKALALWSGPPYADLDGHHALAPEVARLSDLRVAVLGDRIDADLACGGHNGLIGELEGLTQEYPLQERFRGQHMLALHRAGRQVEALRSFERTRRFLGEEMGLEPSADLQRLEQRILAGDEELLLRDAGDPSGRSAVRGYELREVVETRPSRETYRAYQRSVGREVTVDVLGAEIADDPVFIANYLADTQRVAALEHPNIGFVHDTWREPGHAYLVSRWFGGGSLADRLRGEPLRMAAAMAVIDQIGAAVSYAHRHGVAHGDLTAANVMLDDEGNAHLTGFVVGSGHEPDIAADRRIFAALAHLLLVGRAPRAAGDELDHDLLGSDLPTGVDVVFDLAFESNAGYGRVEDFLRALRQVLGFDSVVPTSTTAEVELHIRNPYKGLRAFQESDADDFYGRADLIERLIDRLDHNRLVAVVGPSGSGKSSVVKAGLAARVRAREDGVLHLQTEMFPGAFPFEELEGALLRVGVNRDSVIDDLLADERGLLRVLKQILPSDDSELLLVIDQFEELFSMVSERKVEKLFLRSLATAVADPRSRLRVVMTMRADFFDRPLESPEFAALMEAGLVPVSIPDRDGLAAAVSQPALSVGLDFEDGLIDRIVRDLDDQPGGLPLLQYAMTELVEQRTSSRLTFAAYEGIGGVYGALGQRAEDLYQSLKPRAQEALRQSFLRMVSVDESAKDLRRRVTQAELLATEVDEQSLNEALHLFGGHRLLTFDLDPVTRARTVEVAHEALTREWERLDGWITDEHDDLVVRRRVDEALAEWRESSEDPSFLPGGSRLAQFQDWSNSTSLALSSHEREFLGAGAARDDELEQRAVNRRRRLLAGLATVALAMTVVAVFALVQKRSSDRVAFDSETGRLASEAVIREQSNPQLGLLLAAESFNREESSATLGALQRTMIDIAPIVGFSDHEALQIEWEGGRVFLLTETGIDVLDSSSYELTHQFEVQVAERLDWGVFDPGRDGELIPFAASANASWVGTAAIDGSFRLIDVENEQAMTVGSSKVSSATFSRSGDMLALGYDHGGVEVLGLPGLEQLLSIPALDDADSFADITATSHAAGWFPEYEAQSFRAGAVAFDPDGSMLAIAQGPRVAIISLPSGELLAGPTVTTSTAIGAGAGQPFVAQSMWFDESELVVKGMQTLVFISVANGDFLFKAPLIANRNVEQDFWPTVVRKLESGMTLTLLPDGRLLVVETIRPPDEQLSSFATLTARSVTTSEIEFTSQIEEAMAVSPDGESWVVGQAGRLVFGALSGKQLLAESAPRRAADAKDFISASQLESVNDRPPLLSLSADGTIAASGAENGVLTRFDGFRYSTADGVLRGRVRFGDSGLTALRDHLVISFLPRATVFDGSDFSTMLTVQDFAGTFGISPSGTSIAYESCGPAAGPSTPEFQVCVGSGIKIADLESGETIAELFIGAELETIEWHPLDDVLFAVDNRGQVHAWNSVSWSLLDSPLVKLDVEVRTIRLSPDGQLAAVVENSAAVRLVATNSGKTVQVIGGDARLATPREHAEHPWFSADSAILLTTEDGTVRLWDVATGAQIGGPFPNDLEVSAGGRSGDVLELVTAVDDDLLIWNLDTSTWFDTACDAVGRNMTKAEWEQFGPRDTEYRATCPQYPIEE